MRQRPPLPRSAQACSIGFLPRLRFVLKMVVFSSAGDGGSASMSLDHNWVTAIATAASAVFAATIWWVNWRQLRHTRAVERAYISGGGPLDPDDLNTFIFTVNNYGKTPGVLLEYAVEFCPLDAYRTFQHTNVLIISAPPSMIASTRRDHRDTSNSAIASPAAPTSVIRLRSLLVRRRLEEDAHVRFCFDGACARHRPPRAC